MVTFTQASGFISVGEDSASLNKQCLIKNINIQLSFNRLVSGAGDIKLTKDGNVLLHEMVRCFLFILTFFGIFLFK